MSRSASLLQLQSIDLELDANHARLSAIENALGDDPAVKQAQRDVVATQAELHTGRVAVQNLEYENQTLGQKIAEVDSRMYGGSVSNPKELQDLQNEASSLKRRRETLEEKQFAALLAVEASEVRGAEAQHRLEQAEAAASQSHGNLREERDRLRVSVARLEINHSAAASGISAGDLELYTRLRQSKKGRAVSQLDEGACTACGVAPSSSRIQAARQGNELILCGNCGRILCADS
jgi:predicted  nucleic acid-binding Zn-ribbon protein